MHVKQRCVRIVNFINRFLPNFPHLLERLSYNANKQTILFDSRYIQSNNIVDTTLSEVYSETDCCLYTPQTLIHKPTVIRHVPNQKLFLLFSLIFSNVYVQTKNNKQKHQIPLWNKSLLSPSTPPPPYPPPLSHTHTLPSSFINSKE